MRSMTGFGSGATPLDHSLVRVEIRALNHRHQDVRVRVPSDLSESTFFLEDLARKTLGRGRFDIHASIEGGSTPHAEFDLERLKTLYLALRGLGETLDTDARVELSTLALLPGVIAMRGKTRAELEPALASAFRAAVLELDKMRREEGDFLCKELVRLLDGMEEKLEKVRARAESRGARFRERLETRIADLLAPHSSRPEPPSVDKDRLEMEIAILAEKSDVTEEITRLKSHTRQLRSWLSSAEPQGKKLDFLIQELGREVNTIGAKSHDEELTMFVVELKSDLEKLREQVQNIE
jgi:uncharacterized protein (TIGR00255 family)